MNIHLKAYSKWNLNSENSEKRIYPVTPKNNNLINKGKEKGGSRLDLWLEHIIQDNRKSIKVANELVYTMNTKGLIPLVRTLLAKIVSPIVHPSMINIIINGITSHEVCDLASINDLMFLVLLMTNYHVSLSAEKWKLTTEVLFSVKNQRETSVSKINSMYPKINSVCLMILVKI